MPVPTRTAADASAKTFRIDPGVASFFDTIRMGCVIAGNDGSIRYRNTLATKWLPAARTLDGAFAQARFLGTFNGWVSELDTLAHGDANLQFDCALRRPDAGSPLLHTLRCTPMHDAVSGGVQGAVILLEEGAPHAAIEQRLEISRRLASLGKLAAQVAHELNNPLDGILRYINLAMRVLKTEPESKLQDYLRESRIGLMRMARIIGDLLEFTRSSDSEFEQASVNELIEQAIRNFATAAKAGRVVIAADFQTQEMPIVHGSRLYQVCCNLLKNAIDAMPDGGTLSITAGIVDDHVVIRVADTGAGLPDPPEKVFEPFYTTKHAGKGTGIGLAICKEFVTDMGGTITAAHGDERGAVFTVRLPLQSLS